MCSKVCGREQCAITVIITRKNIVECREQLTIGKDNYAYFLTTNGTPRDNGSKTSEKHETLPKLKNYYYLESEDWLILAMFSYNTSVHEATKCTAYELVFGKLAREPSSEALSQNEKLQTYDDYLIKFVIQLHEMRTQARKNLMTAN